MAYFHKTLHPDYLEKWYQVGEKVDTIDIAGILTSKRYSGGVPFTPVKNLEIRPDLRLLFANSDSYPHVALLVWKD